ncbi:MAG: tetratricopeptide repeat protein [Gammaproteobacteria bacterium]|nr:tetratricopeptide repeat protein [Gammaproteobacteria bacterium]
MKCPLPILAFILAGTLGGCATQGAATPGPAAETAAAPAAAGEETSPPSGDFSPEVLYSLLVAEIAGQRGDLATALALYLEAARATRDAGIAERSARIAMAMRDTERGIEAARIWLEAAPESQEARQLLAISLIKAGRAEEALQQLDQLMSADQTDPARRFLIIAALLSREHTGPAALEVMRGLVEKHGDQPEAHYALGELAVSENEPGLALQAVDEALRLKPDWTDAMVLRARALTLAGETDAALAYLAAAASGHPQDNELAMARARLLIQADRMDEAREAFQGLVRRNPDNGDALFALGLLSLQAGLDEEAEQAFRRLLEVDGKTTARAPFYLGQVAEKRKDYQAALDWYSEVRSGPNYNEAQLRIAVVLARLERIDEALAQLEDIAARNPAQRPRLYLVEGEILANAGRLDQAMGIYNQALLELPGNADIRYARALLAEKMDNLDLLESDLKLLIERDPENALALNALGYTLADRTDRHAEALRYIEQALELSPDDAAIIDSMGWVQYRLGNLEAAAAHLRRALELRRGDPEIAAHLGEVLWALGRRDAAREVWQAVLAEHPDDAILRETITRLTGQEPPRP